MKFAQFYRQYLSDLEMMQADDYVPLTDKGWERFSTAQLVKALVDGRGGVGDVGPELARRNALDLVPGDNWGY